MKIGGTNIIDFARVSNIPKFTVNVKAGDSKRKISLTLLENNIPVNLNDYTVVVACKKSDGNDIFNTVTKINAVNGICEVEITNQMLALDTDLPCEIVLYGEDETIATSSSFIINKISSVRDEVSIVSSNEFTTLSSALSKVKSFQSQIDNLVLESGGDSNLEVVQARVDINGSTFNTLKGRLDNIENATLTGIFNTNSIYWSLGTLNQGIEVDSEVRLRSDFFNPNQNFNITINNGYKYSYHYYNSSKAYVGTSDWKTSNEEIIASYPYYRVILSKTNDSNIAITEASNINIDVFLEKKTSLYEKILKNESDISNVIQDNEKILQELYGTPFKSIGTFQHGNFTEVDTISPSNKNRASIVKVQLNAGDNIGFIYDLNKKYKFALDKTGDGKISYIQGSEGAYHFSSYTITENANYNFMVAKLDNSDISEDELIEISNSFGYGSNLSNILKLEEKIEELKSNANSILYGKTIVAIGDSFIDYRTQGLGNDLLSKIAKGNNMTIHNYGLSSSSLAYDSKQTVLSLMDRYQTMLNEVPNADYVIVLAGHNDSNPSLHGGTAIDIGNNEDTVNTTFKGALNILINALLNQYPKAGILFLTPFNRRGTELPYVKAMEEICEIYSIPCFNNYKSSGICFQNSTHLGIYDQASLHLNGLGNERMARKYIPILETL